MNHQPLRIATIGGDSAVRPLLAAHALRHALGETVTVLALSSRPPALLAAATALVESVLEEAVPWAEGALDAAPSGCDLVIATDMSAVDGDVASDTKGLRRVPDGGLLLVWDGEEPQSAAQCRDVLAQLLLQAESLHTAGVIALAQARRRRRAPSSATEALSLASEAREARQPFHGLVGSSQVMAQLVRRIQKVARHNSPVLVLGETGTGKDIVAQALHAESERSRHPMVAFNCALGDVHVIDSELFGHARGAYTGASAPRQGLVRSAHHGTLFLDEVGELPLAVQSKLLRLLEQREVRPVGADRTERVDVRLIGATHRDLRKGIDEGWFRADLYHRLAVTLLEVPPLRARLDDLPELAAAILMGLRRETGRAYRDVPESVLRLWQGYDWPGNVRELRNLLRRAVVEASGLDLPIAALVPDGLQGALRTPHARTPKVSLAQVEAALAQSGGNRKHAAEVLGISRATLYRMLPRSPSAAS